MAWFEHPACQSTGAAPCEAIPLQAFDLAVRAEWTKLFVAEDSVTTCQCDWAAGPICPRKTAGILRDPFGVSCGFARSYGKYFRSILER